MIVAIILIYIVLLFVSSRYSKKSKGHSPWFIVAISMVGTSISGVTFVSVPGMVGASGFAYLQMVLGFVAGYVVIAFVLLPLYYSLNLTSLYEYLKSRFGQYSYKTGAGFFLVSKTLGAGVRMYLTAIVLQLIVFEPLGVPFWLNVGLTVLVIWTYTLRGLRSLVWTDMVQALSLLTVVGLSVFFIGKELGVGNLVSSISSSEMSRVFFFDDAGDTRFFFKQFFAGMFTTIAMTGLDQDMMQKNLSCKNLRDGRKNVLSYGVAFLPVNLLFLSLGVLLYQFAASRGISVAKADDLFPTIACGADAAGVAYMPLIVKALFILGLIASSLSSSGSALNALTTSFCNDIIGGLPQSLRSFAMKEQACDGKDCHQEGVCDRSDLGAKGTIARNGWKVRLGCALVLGLVMLGFRLIGNDSVINAVYTIASYTYGPLLGLYFFGIFTKVRLRDKLVPVVCVLSPLLCLGLSFFCKGVLGYTIGFELLLINAAITALGLVIIRK